MSDDSMSSDEDDDDMDGYLRRMQRALHGRSRGGGGGGGGGDGGSNSSRRQQEAPRHFGIPMAILLDDQEVLNGGERADKVVKEVGRVCVCGGLCVPGRGNRWWMQAEGCQHFQAFCRWASTDVRHVCVSVCVCSLSVATCW